MSPQRDALQQKVAEALIQSKAINFDAVAKVISDHAEEAMRSGVDIGMWVGRFNHYACGYPSPIMREALDRSKVLEQQEIQLPGQVLGQ